MSEIPKGKVEVRYNAIALHEIEELAGIATAQPSARPTVPKSGIGTGDTPGDTSEG